MKWKVQNCRFIGHPFTLNQSTSYVEELFLQYNDLSVMDFMLSIRSWPFLRQLTIGVAIKSQFVHLVEQIIPAAPFLQELTLRYIHFNDPDELQSCATIVFNSPSPALKWHLYDCRFYPNTMAVLEKIVQSDKAKSMRIEVSLNDEKYQVLRTIISESSCVGNLDISVQDSGSMLKILPLLRQKEQPFPSTYYPCTSIHLTIDTDSLERYRDIIESIQHWTPRVNKLCLQFAWYGRSRRPFLRTELIQAVRNNWHLQWVELDLDHVKYYDDENTKNADEDCCAWLERYCERNRKLHAALDNHADSIPLPIWLYVYHSLASRGGGWADMLYRHLRDNAAGYTLNHWHYHRPNMQETSSLASHASTAAKQKRKRAA